MGKITEYPETHQYGTISIENMPGELCDNDAHLMDNAHYMKGDLGVKIADDGRIWICINGIAFIRFSPHLNGKMSKTDA